MQICKLIKVINGNCDYEYFYKVTGIGPVGIFDSLTEAEKFIREHGCRYQYSEEICQPLGY